ncbi:flavin reductase family protein [Alcaligenes endophyticus]|uniref:Flavin reductase family protein n=1 Tax=Alcaligenes endophyticus TaxID=1929088 RepID=A0ABT8EF16_9BURK|nr:flavin reductase family protein [Alcaligenes endophyticus]MCX5590459.1 flavin reductase family protein [Alcaligenes endophyticus]MDN4119877.1 flavin reductase family protein [Alcaligenes endophyticus]
MYFDIAQLDYKKCYKLLASTVVPRPIAWVISSDKNGVINAAPFSFFNFFSGFPPVICLGVGYKDGKPKDTLFNIMNSGEFIINMVTENLAEKMNETAYPFSSDVDELRKTGLDTKQGIKIKLPFISESPVAIECIKKEIISIDTTAKLIIGHVVGIHINDEAITDPEKLYINTEKLKLIGRMESPGWYIRTEDRFKIR